MVSSNELKVDVTENFFSLKWETLSCLILHMGLTWNTNSLEVWSLLGFSSSQTSEVSVSNTASGQWHLEADAIWSRGRPVSSYFNSTWTPGGVLNSKCPHGSVIVMFPGSGRVGTGGKRALGCQQIASNVFISLLLASWWWLPLRTSKAIVLFSEVFRGNSSTFLEISSSDIHQF